MMILLNFPLYAKGNQEYLNQFSINKTDCIQSSCYFPKKFLEGSNIVINGKVDWGRDENLIIHTKGNILFKSGGKIISKNGAVILKSGMEPGNKGPYRGTVTFEEDSKIEIQGDGKVKIYYNPKREGKGHKYHNPNHFLYNQHVKAGANNDNLSVYMLVNNVYDLQNIVAFLSGSYALSQDIDATKTKDKAWLDGEGFKPLTDKDERFIPITDPNKEGMPFSGDFDGNGYSIDGLYINRPDENEVGLFGGCYGWDTAHNRVENLTLKDFDITGHNYVGSLAGSSVNSDLSNIKVINSKIKGSGIVGGLVGTITKVNIERVHLIDPIEVTSSEFVGFITGGASKSKISLLFDNEQGLIEVLKKYKHLGVGYLDKYTEIDIKTSDEQTKA